MLPLFPLNLVVYPGEKLNLHVFEPRYRQLISECLAQKSTFGIPAFIDNKVEDYGTEVRIISLDKQYEDGRMDIKTEGISAFRLLHFENPIPGKLYAGGEVEFFEQKPENLSEEIMTRLLNKFSRLYTLLQLKLDVSVNRVPYLSYEIAHKIGLSVAQEFELLTIPTENERQRYLLSHLERVIPIVADMEKTKERIRMNGHFKTLDPLNF